MRRRRTPEIIAGRVNSDGSIAAGDGFTVQKTGTGVYVLALSASFRLIGCTVSGATGAQAGTTTTYTASGVTVTMLTPSTGATTDAGFAFTAVGVQQ